MEISCLCTLRPSMLFSLLGNDLCIRAIWVNGIDGHSSYLVSPKKGARREHDENHRDGMHSMGCDNTRRTFILAHLASLGREKYTMHIPKNSLEAVAVFKDTLRGILRPNDLPRKP